MAVLRVACLTLLVRRLLAVPAARDAATTTVCPTALDRVPSTTPCNNLVDVGVYLSLLFEGIN